ncbi:Sensory neuron membrane protein 1 [Clonorchis sinensis]|uniref:Sensory neuron membrane protein 1 n=1 Tax=Clonorchis sinensis TaxID=79923 RepID=A0A8T1N297_CLOSI|nr:Sensory neuron membrane protein 1 [Clonorchis sinensis]
MIGIRSLFRHISIKIHCLQQALSSHRTITSITNTDGITTERTTHKVAENSSAVQDWFRPSSGSSGEHDPRDANKPMDIIYLPGRRLYENWRNPTVPIFFKVHLFNVTNVDDILRGGRPRVEVVGPFVYRNNLAKRYRHVYFQKNTSSPLHIRMHTGAYDLNDAGKVVACKGQSIQSVWDGEEANLFKGIQGVRLPPSIQLGDRVPMYLPDLCRSVTLTATETAQSSILPGFMLMKLTAPEADELDATENWENRKFCKSTGACTPKGFMTLEPCYAENGFSIPLYLSFPYFMDADTRASGRIDGVPKADRDKHRIYLLAEPTTGVTLEAHLRFQLNLFMANTHERYRNMSGPFYFPLAWVELEIVTPLRPLKFFKENILDLRNKAPHLMSILAVVCGIISLLLLATFAFRMRFYRTHGSVNLALHLHDANDSPDTCKKEPIDFRVYLTLPESDSKEVLQSTSESDQLSDME